MRPRSSGFTLIELMIVVSIMGLLAAIAIPKFANLVRKSQEGATKGNLGALRSILSIYYSDNEGQFPKCAAFSTNSTVFTSSLLPKYASKIPESYPPNYHSASTNVMCHTHAGGQWNCTFEPYGWIYAGESATAQYHGTVTISCTHTDTKGSSWRAY